MWNTTVRKKNRFEVHLTVKSKEEEGLPNVDHKDRGGSRRGLGTEHRCKSESKPSCWGQGRGNR